MVSDNNINVTGCKCVHLCHCVSSLSWPTTCFLSWWHISLIAIDKAMFFVPLPGQTTKNQTIQLSLLVVKVKKKNGESTNNKQQYNDSFFVWNFCWVCTLHQFRSSAGYVWHSQNIGNWKNNMRNQKLFCVSTEGKTMPTPNEWYTLIDHTCNLVRLILLKISKPNDTSTAPRWVSK